MSLPACARKEPAVSIQVYSGTNAYDDLVQSDICDALYIPLPTRYEQEQCLQEMKPNPFCCVHVLRLPSKLYRTEHWLLLLHHTSLLDKDSLISFQLVVISFFRFSIPVASTRNGSTRPFVPTNMSCWRNQSLCPRRNSTPCVKQHMRVGGIYKTAPCFRMEGAFNRLYRKHGKPIPTTR